MTFHLSLFSVFCMKAISCYRLEEIAALYKHYLVFTNRHSIAEEHVYRKQEQHSGYRKSKNEPNKQSIAKPMNRLKSVTLST